MGIFRTPEAEKKLDAKRDRLIHKEYPPFERFCLIKDSRYIYVIELKLRNNGGKEAATEQILNRQYMEPFKADKRKVIGLGIELDEEGKGLLGWKRAE